MSYYQAIILGLIQGLTEFLPISSSAHLYLVPWVFGWDHGGLAFDVALHWGTLLGVVIYYKRDIAALFHGSFGWIKGKRDWPARFPLYIVLGTIPAGLIGLAFEDYAETIFRSPWVTATMLASIGLLLYFTDKNGKKTNDIQSINWKQAVLIGTAQGLAIVPGVSRSGITITIALLFAFTRQAAVRFSFLLSIPIIFCAGLLNVKFFITNITNPIFLSGFIASAISGYTAIWFLVTFVQKKSFAPFVIYRLALALAIVVLLISR